MFFIWVICTNIQRNYSYTSYKFEVERERLYTKYLTSNFSHVNFDAITRTRIITDTSILRKLGGRSPTNRQSSLHKIRYACKPITRI